jgi:hypothetical protein
VITRLFDLLVKPWIHKHGQHLPKLDKRGLRMRLMGLNVEKEPALAEDPLGLDNTG